MEQEYKGIAYEVEVDDNKPTTSRFYEEKKAKEDFEEEMELMEEELLDKHRDHSVVPMEYRQQPGPSFEQPDHELDKVVQDVQQNLYVQKTKPRGRKVVYNSLPPDLSLPQRPSDVGVIYSIAAAIAKERTKNRVLKQDYEKKKKRSTHLQALLKDEEEKHSQLLVDIREALTEVKRLKDIKEQLLCLYVSQ